MILELADGSSALVRGAAALLLGLHVTAGIVGIASGAVALVVAKGSAGHRKAGTLFLGSMLTMAIIGTALSPFLPRPSWANLIGGTFTLYLVVTSWATVRRAADRAGLFEAGAALVAVGIVALAVTLDARAYGIFAAAAALAAAGDLRLLVRRRLLGAERLVRHLWRMCVALLIAATSLFLGQPQVFPSALRGSVLLAAPEIAIVVALAYWLVRVRRPDRGAAPAVRADAGASPSADLRANCSDRLALWNEAGGPALPAPRSDSNSR